MISARSEDCDQNSISLIPSIGTSSAPDIEAIVGLECDVVISGQMKIAPEHVSDDVLRMMGKPSSESLLEFKEMFDRVKEEVGKDIYLTYYLIAAHPGCYEHHMKELLDFCHDRLKTLPEQVQIFTPTPSTVSTMMYHVRRDWEDRNNIKAEHSMQIKQRQKEILFSTKTARDVASGRKGRQYSDDSDRGERSRSGDRDRKPYGERRDLKNRDGGFRERKPYGDRKEFGDASSRFTKRDSDDGDSSDRSDSGDRKPFVKRDFDDRGDRKSYGEKKEFRERKPDFQDGESEERRPFERRSNDRGDFRERKPYGDRKFNDRGDRRSYGDRKDFKDRDCGFREKKDFGDRKPYGEKRDFRDRDGGFRERKPYGDRKFDDRGDRKSYGDKKDFGDGKSNDRGSKKPYVKKPKRGFQYKRA